MKLQHISLMEIAPPARAVRAEIDEQKVEELAESIRAVGLLNPITVRPTPTGYEVVAGHRRWMACNRLQMVTAPCLVLDDGEASGTAAKIHENLFREDISPVEEAAFYAELLPEFGDDTEKLAEACKRKREHIEKRLNLLHGDARILQALAEKSITLGVAEQLNRLHREWDRGYYLGWAVRQGATVSTVREWVQSANLQAELGAASPPAPGDVAPTPLAETTEPVCFICKHTEPRWDVEFWYIHRSCRMIVERNAQEQREAAYGGPVQPAG